MSCLLFCGMWSTCFLLFTDAFDTEQLLECMGQLKRALPVNVPIYDFKNHRRCSERLVVISYALWSCWHEEVSRVYIFEFSSFEFSITLSENHFLLTLGDAFFLSVQLYDHLVYCMVECKPMISMGYTESTEDVICFLCETLENNTTSLSVKIHCVMSTTFLQPEIYTLPRNSVHIVTGGFVFVISFTLWSCHKHLYECANYFQNHALFWLVNLRSLYS